MLSKASSFAELFEVLIRIVYQQSNLPTSNSEQLIKIEVFNQMCFQLIRKPSIQSKTSFSSFWENAKYLNLKCSLFWRPLKSSTPMVFAMRKRRDRLSMNSLKVVMTFNNVDIHRNHIVAWLPANVVEVMESETNDLILASLFSFPNSDMNIAT